MKTINYILLTAIALSFSSCMQQLKEKKEAAGTIPQKAYEYMTTARLTVSESKRLTAKVLRQIKMSRTDWRTALSS